MIWLKGKDGEFNSYEKARTYFVYSSAILTTPIFLHIAYYFIVTRKNLEMRVRESYAVISMAFIVWIWMVLSTMWHMTLDLETATKDWETFIIRQSRTEGWILLVLSWFCFTAGFSCNFYRVWLFWYRMVAAKEVTHSCERCFTRANWRNFFYSRKRRWLGNRRIVFCLCFLWFFLVSVPIVDEYFRFTQITNLKILVEACACLPLLCVEVILMWKANDIFGVVVEYKMLLVATLVEVIFIASLELIPAIKHSYYKIIIEFVSTSYIICFYSLWLKCYIKSFNIHNEGFGSASCLSSTSCDIQLSDAVKRVPKRLVKNYTLADILSNKMYHAQFKHHIKQTLCAENLCFFVDVYIYRKALEYDPFIDMSDVESNLIHECAAIKMEWIDEWVRENRDLIPSTRHIYNLYIKPLSEMEVNIPGEVRQKLISEFENQRMPVRIKADKREKFENNNRGRVAYSGYLSERRESTQSLTAVTPRATFSSQREHPGLHEPSIIHLFPVWKCLVNIMNHDSLVRFKARVDTVFMCMEL